jgi:uncharacterized hydrophobic protein (TIGR00271 family)
VPLLRITCPRDRTDAIVESLTAAAEARDVSVIPGASRTSGGDLILADVPRGSIDRIIDHLAVAHPQGVRVAVEASEPLYPREGEAADADDDSVIWTQLSEELHDVGRLSWANTLLVLIASAIAAIGIIQDQLLLIIGAVTMSPDYYPVADTCLAVVVRDRRRALRGLRTLAVIFTASIVGGWAVAELLVRTHVITANSVPSQEITLFISEPDALTIIVAVLAGIAGALAVTLPGSRGLVGVFVSITTVPAAANIGVALVAREWVEMRGAAIQLTTNVASLLVAGVLTLEARRRIRQRSL